MRRARFDPYNKQITLYNIAAFNSMQSPDDSFLYEQRQGHKERGLNNLTTLETAFERSWEEQQNRLWESCEALHEVMQQSYQEMWLRGQDHYEQMKRDLADMRNQFEKLILDPSFQLSSEMPGLCEEMQQNHLLCAVVGDSRLSVAETLITVSTCLFGM